MDPWSSLASSLDESEIQDQGENLSLRWRAMEDTCSINLGLPCANICICIQTYTCTSTCMNTGTHMHIHAYTHTHAHERAHTHAHTQMGTLNQKERGIDS